MKTQNDLSKGGKNGKNPAKGVTLNGKSMSKHYQGQIKPPEICSAGD